MLTIQNYKKIKNRWFGDWQIGKISEDTSFYALQAFNKDKRSVTVVILREGELSHESFELFYKIVLSEDGKKLGDAIEDIIYKSVLEDMELFGESLVHYLNTI